MTADAREIRRWLRGIRRSHADRSIWQQFEDAYMWLFAVALFGAMAGNVVLNLNARVTGSLYPSTLQPIVVPLALGVALRLLVSFGPIAASPATGFWLLGTPMSRSVLLRPSYLLTIAITALFGPFVALVGWAALGSAWAEVLGAGILMSALLALTACLAVLAQRPRQRYWNSRHARWLADALLVFAAIPAIYEIWTSIEWRRTTAGARVITLHALSIEPERTFSEQAFGYTPTLIGLGLLVALVPLLRFTARRLDRLSRTAVVAGGEAMAGLAGAAASLDLALISDMAVNRHWRQRATVRRSRRGFFAGAPALVMREMVRVLRWPRRFVVGFALLLLPYLSHEIGWRAIVPVVTALAGFAAARPFGDGLRSVGRSAGLTRALGLSPRTLRLAMAVVPGIFIFIWFFLAAPVLGPAADPSTAQASLNGYSSLMTPEAIAQQLTVLDPGIGAGLSSPWAGAPVALALAIGVLAGVIRYAVAPAPKYDGILVSTPMGAVPPGLFSQPLRGVDVVLISLAPVLFNLPTPWLLAIPTAVLTLVIAVVPQRR